MRLPVYARLAISACSLLLLTCGLQPSGASDPDVNDDGVVNVVDVSIVNSCVSNPSAPQCLAADVNGDGVVDSIDLAIVVQSFGQTGFPVSDIEQARQLFCDQHDVAAADDKLAAFLSGPSAQTNPQHFQTAKFLRAVTRLLRPFAEPSGDATPTVIDSVPEALDAVGVGTDGRNPLDWTASPPVDDLGQCFVPMGGRSEQVEAALRNELVPAIAESLADLEAVTSSWEDACRYRVIHRENGVPTSEDVARVELDYSDALALQTALRAARSALHFLTAYETDVDLHQVVCEIAPLHRTVQSFLEDPAFDDVWTLADDTSTLPLSSDDAQAAISSFELTLDALIAELDDPLDDLVSLDPVSFTPERETLTRMQIAAALAAFDDPTVIPGVRICGDARLDLAQVFSGLDLRALLPPFVGNLANYLGVPDPTLGGVLPGGTAANLSCTADTDGPVFEEPAEFLVVNPHPLALRLVDPDVGANPGHVVDPDSLVVFVDFLSFDCSATIDGLHACSAGEEPCDITSLVGKTPNADGSLTLTGELAVSGTDSRCGVIFGAEAADGVGNLGTDFSFLEIVGSGLLTRFDPPGGTVTSPVPVSMEISAPFGDDPTGHTISLFAFGCGAIGIGGVLVPGSDLGDVFFEDVTSLFGLTAGPGLDSLTRSGSVSVSSSCQLDLQVDYSVPSFGDSVSYFVEVAP